MLRHCLRSSQRKQKGVIFCVPSTCNYRHRRSSERSWGGWRSCNRWRRGRFRSISTLFVFKRWGFFMRVVQQNFFAIIEAHLLLSNKLYLRFAFIENFVGFNLAFGQRSIERRRPDIISIKTCNNVWDSCLCRNSLLPEHHFGQVSCYTFSSSLWKLLVPQCDFLCTSTEYLHSIIAHKLAL